MNIGDVVVTLFKDFSFILLGDDPIVFFFLALYKLEKTQKAKTESEKKSVASCVAGDYVISSRESSHTVPVIIFHYMD